MTDQNKFKIALAIFVSLILFTEPGREVLMEIIGIALVLGIGGIVTLAGFLIVDHFKTKTK